VTSQDRADARERLEPAALAVVRELVAELHAGRRVTVAPGSSLERDLGIGSLARMELLLRLERRTGAHVREHEAIAAETVGELLAALVEPGDGRRLAPVAAPTAISADTRPDEARTLVDVLVWHAERNGNRVHVHFEDEARPGAWTYAELLAEARRIAGGLVDRGMAPGDAVALMLPTGLEFFAVFFGVLLAGAVPVPIYPPSRLGQIEEHLGRQARILGNATARLLVADSAAGRVGPWLQARVPSLAGVVSPAELATADALPLRTAGADDVALLQYTSGSTGDPKGVVLTHANLLANIRAMGEAVGAVSTDVFVSWLPLYHDMGLIGAWLGSLYHACTFVVMSPTAFLVRPERWLWAIHRHRGTLSAGPNFAYERCARRIDAAQLAGLELSSWRVAFNGAERISPGTLERFADRFRPYGFRRESLAPVYGLAETCVGLCFPPPGRGPRVDRVDRRRLATEARAIPSAAEDAIAFVSCGRPLPRHEVRVVDGGHELGERTLGRIQFRGPSATRGYRANDAATRALFDHGWLETGDLGYVATGELFVTGRAKDVVIRAGRHVFPYELEDAIAELPGARRGGIAVFACPDEQSGTERLVVVVETELADEGARSELRAHVDRLSMTLFGAPADEVVLAPPHSVPKTSSGKLRRGACRDLYLGGTLGHPRSVRRQLSSLALHAAVPLARRVVRRMLGLLWAGWFWACFALIAVVAWLAAMVVPGARIRRAVVSALARALFVMVGVRLRCSGQAHFVDGPSLVCANHTSYLDVVVLAAVLPGRFVLVAKRELQDQWLMRVSLPRIGVTFVERHARETSAHESDRLAAVIRAGGSLALFPEGTIRRAPGLFSFQLGAFLVATRTGAPIVPMAIVGTRSLLRADQWFPRRGPVQVTVLPPRKPAGDAWDDAVALRDRVREDLASATGDPPVDVIDVQAAP